MIAVQKLADFSNAYARGTDLEMGKLPQRIIFQARSIPIPAAAVLLNIRYQGRAARAEFAQYIRYSRRFRPCPRNI